MKVYLDNAATTPIDPNVIEAMLPFMESKFGNPSSIHAFGREARAAIEKSRKVIASALNVSTSEIFFTSGGTETANMVLFGAVSQLGIKKIISSRIEHHCVLHPLEFMEQHQVAQIEYLNLDENGNIIIDHLIELLEKNSQPVLIALMHGNNEIGNILPIDEIAAIAQKYKAYFFSDTVQTLAHYIFDLQKLPIHFISGSAHKFHGPKGIGLAYVSNKAKISPLIYGGNQERNMRSGTENIYGIVGMAKALEIAIQNQHEDEKHLNHLKSYFFQQIKSQYPEVHINGNSNKHSLSTVLNLCFPTFSETDYLLFNLDIEGIAASGGSACSSGANTGSHVLKAIHTMNNSSSVRFSFSKYNTIDEINQTIRVLKNILSSKFKS